VTETEAASQPVEQPLPEDLAAALTEGVLEVSFDGTTIRLLVRPEALPEVVRALRDRETGPYVHLASLAGLDHGDDLGVVYHLYRLGSAARAVIHVRLPRSSPQVPSIAELLPAADWKEREAGEMFGIEFAGHPDLRKLLLPDDWEGYPLRKDYVIPEHPYLTPDPRHEL
jgi:NADH-quinone oxidoreductase subunit C